MPVGSLVCVMCPVVSRATRPNPAVLSNTNTNNQPQLTEVMYSQTTHLQHVSCSRPGPAPGPRATCSASCPGLRTVTGTWSASAGIASGGRASRSVTPPSCTALRADLKLRKTRQNAWDRFDGSMADWLDWNCLKHSSSWPCPYHVDSSGKSQLVISGCGSHCYTISGVDSVRGTTAANPGLGLTIDRSRCAATGPVAAGQCGVLLSNLQ